MSLSEKEPPPESPQLDHDHTVGKHIISVKFQQVTEFLLRWGIETHGISPIPIPSRVDKRLYQMFFVWFSANFNVLAVSTGSAGPAFFALGLGHSLIVLLVVDVMSNPTSPQAYPFWSTHYSAVFGPKLGTRGMVQSRFSWGYFGSIVPSVLNVFSMQGFLILNCIIGGQTLAAVSGNLNDTLGIVIIGLLSLAVTFCGYKVVHWYESIAWIPNAITFLVMLGVGGKHLDPRTFPPAPTPDASKVLSFACFIASSVISWCTMTPDYGVYHDANASSVRIFTYTYLGFLTASITGHMLGAAFAAAAPGIPSWQSGFDNGNNVGGLFAAVLAPAGGFGKFLVVLVALSIPSACAPTMYTFGTSFMSIAPLFAKVPRYVFTIVSEAILIPVAIVGATRFYTTLVDVLSVIGYWSSAFAAIVLTEHIIFRRRRFDLYIIEDWDEPRRLPPGIAAVLSFLCAFGVIIPSMSQAFYVGPIAKAGSGDVGVLTGFVVAGVCYTIFRRVERGVFSKRG